MKSEIMILEKKTCCKELELVLMKFEQIWKLSKKIINNIIKSNDLDSKPRVKCESYAKGNTN